MSEEHRHGTARTTTQMAGFEMECPPRFDIFGRHKIDCGCRERDNRKDASEPFHGMSAPLRVANRHREGRTLFLRHPCRQ